MSLLGSGSLGVRATQTLNCDFLHVTGGASLRKANVEHLDVKTINNKNLEHIFNHKDEIEDLRKEIQIIKKDIENIRKNIGPDGYTPGRAVTFTISLDDIDITQINWEEFQENLVESVTEASGQLPEAVALVAIKENSPSTEASMEVRFTGSQSKEKAQVFVEKLNSAPRVDMFSRKLKKYSSTPDNFEYNIESFAVGPIQSTNAKLEETKKKLEAPEIDFTKSKAMALDNFKLKSQSGALFIQKYDESIGEYVGGTIVTD